MKTKSNQLLDVFSASARCGGGILDTGEIAFMLRERRSPSFTKFLADCVNKGILQRVAIGLFESTLTPPDPTTAIYKIIKKLRKGFLSYISLESQLSHSGQISQIMMGTVTVITKGRAGTFNTPYGVIEFTHTKRPIDKIAPQLYYDADIGMFRASVDLATADLKNTRRNLHMLESENAD